MIGWIVAAWLLISGVYWVRRAWKAEDRIRFWQNECRMCLQAQAKAELKASSATAQCERMVAELAKVVGALEAQQAKDRALASVAYSARRLH